MKRIRTSTTDPLLIDDVPTPGGGRLGLTFLPGKIDDRAKTGRWHRDLDVDLDVVAEWQPDLLLTLMESHEFDTLGVPQFAEVVGRRFPGWRHLPIVDVGVPDEMFEQAWERSGAEARSVLSRGGKVLIHCRGGIGRTGMIAARLLVELGESPQAAITSVRKGRPSRIETPDQEEHVRAQVWVDPLRDRIRGMMLGAAIGDALGSAFEFMASDDIRRIVGSSAVLDYFSGQPGSLLAGRKPGYPTDDTAMTLALVNALTSGEPVTAISMQTAFGELLGDGGPYGKMYQLGAPGGACEAFLRAYDAGRGPGEEISPDQGGNGSAMRAHPCGVFADRSYVTEIAAEQARLSHPHLAAVASAQTVALIVHEALYNGSFTKRLPSEITELRMVKAWEWAHRDMVRGDTLPPRLRDVSKMSGWVTVATAHAIAELYVDDIETGIGMAAGSGKDTDTVASIAGAMLGALHGAHRLPVRWIDGLKYREVVEAAADSLYVAARERERHMRPPCGGVFYDLDPSADTLQTDDCTPGDEIS
jgi:ADP-ribosyl-[dinitrogen reductase] hydrolase